MAQTTEVIDFRRAFVWLLCGMLLPSVALVAFGVVAVANERAAVERRLAEEYDARLRVLARTLQARLDAAGFELATSASQYPRDALLGTAQAAKGAIPPPLAEATRRAATMSAGNHLWVADGETHAWAVARRTTGVVFAPLDLDRLAAEASQLGERRYPGERARFRLLPPREGGLSALKRIVAEARPGATSVVAHLPLPAPLEGWVLAAELPGDDPAAALAFRNRTLYIALLGLLYSGIGVGFGLTLREIHRAFKLSRLKTDFVANISHELRTPLTSVRLFAETLREGRAETKEEERECLELISSESERLSNLVDRLLDWSRLESGRRTLTRESVPVRDLLDRVDNAFRAHQLDATYTTLIDDDLPKLSVEPDAMAQVILNLLHNAVKYTGDDKRIVLRAYRARSTHLPGRGRKNAVAIEVQDNGPGVRAQDRKRIFERFYRADDLLSRRTEGTGLGLAIAKRMVELHGGRIELDTRVGEGSTFRVLLPEEAR